MFVRASIKPTKEDVKMETKFNDDGMMECPECEGTGYDDEDCQMTAYDAACEDAYGRGLYQEELGYDEIEQDVILEWCNDYANDKCNDYYDPQEPGCECELCKGTGEVDWVTNVMARRTYVNEN